MVLLYAVLAGLLAGSVRAWLTNRRFTLPDVQLLWLVPLAFLPQWVVFFWRPMRGLVSESVAAVVLVSSLVLLLIFAWANRQHRAFWWLGLGNLLNLAVIVFNGGFMPISPETVGELYPPSTWPEDWQIGRWVNSSKDVILPEAETRLAWLSDRFLLPEWFPNRVAFSLGDALISIGAFWLLWQAGGTPSSHPLSSSLISSKEDLDRS